MKDVDLFATNDKSEMIDLDKLQIEKEVSIQVKTKYGKRNLSAADYIIALDALPSSRVFNADWLMRQVAKHSQVRSWLARSLRWLPEDYLKHFNLVK